MSKKIEMQKVTVKVWHRKNRSRLIITQPNGKAVVLDFKSQETLDTFADTVLDLLDALDDDPLDENDTE